MPASELPLWRAWQYIEPWGYTLLNQQVARLAQIVMGLSGRFKDVPPLNELMLQDPDWRSFDPDLQEEIESDRLMRNLKAVMPGEPNAS